MTIEVDDYERFAEQGRRRFRTIVICLLVGLLLLVYAPWALVPSRALSTNVAGAISAIAGLVVLGAWQALLAKVGNPRDSAEPTAASRRAALVTLMVTAGAMLALLVTLAGGSYLAGFIEIDGLIGTGLLVFVMGGSLVRALFFRLLRTPPSV